MLPRSYKTFYQTLFIQDEYIKRDPNFTTQPSIIFNELNSATIIMPYRNKKRPQIKFLIKQKQYDTTDYFYLTFGANGSYQVLDENFNPSNAPLSQFIFQTKAFVEQDKWLATGKFKLKPHLYHDQLILHFDGNAEMNSVFKTGAKLFIDKNGELSASIYHISNKHLGLQTITIPTELITKINYDFAKLNNYLKALNENNNGLRENRRVSLD